MGDKLSKNVMLNMEPCNQERLIMFLLCAPPARRTMNPSILAGERPLPPPPIHNIQQKDRSAERQPAAEEEHRQRPLQCLQVGNPEGHKQQKGKQKGNVTEDPREMKP